MTYEKLERANELMQEIDRLTTIQQLFCTQSDVDHAPSFDYVPLARTDITFDALIPADICDEIIALVQKKKDDLIEEFNAL